MKSTKMLTILVLAVVVVACGGRVCMAGEIAAWGRNSHGQLTVPSPNSDFVAVAGGFNHSLGLKADGSIAAWGYNAFGQGTAPLPNEDFIAVAAGGDHSLGLKSDGSIAAWGRNNRGQCTVPSPNADFNAVAAGSDHSLGLKSDGSIAAWGSNDYGQSTVPSPNADFVAIAAGEFHSLGLKSDGSIAAWGSNDDGQCTVPDPNEDFIAVAAGGYHSLGLKSDGSIAAWGENGSGQSTVPSPNADFIAVAAGGLHSLGLKAKSMGTAFTYQGQLYDTNSPAGGTYDFQFGLYSGENIQEGNTLSMDDIDVIDGYFTAELDFGGDVFDGFARLLEIEVRPGQSSEPNDFVTLSPRQEITPAPYASYALGTRGISVDDAGNVGIGTTTPRDILDIQGDTFMPKLILENTDTAYGHVGIELKRGETQAECSISFQDQDTEIWKNRTGQCAIRYTR